jgi:mono/diheme cytochrome c family protein
MNQTIVRFCLGFCVLVVVASCSDVRREPGRIYMPDMAYSRAVETYADHSNLTNERIFYNARPVDGTVKRGEGLTHYEMLKDTTGTYVQAVNMKNPLPAPDSATLIEAERIYLINCGICHGPKLDGNGPLYKGGEGPYPAKPATLVGDAKYEAMAEGTMFHSITYGKNLMGSYASQVTPKQRWMIIQYIKAKQAAGKSGGGASMAGADSTGSKASGASPAGNVATDSSKTKK